MLKSDRFLADAHWEIVENKTLIEDPYCNNESDFEVSGQYNVSCLCTNNIIMKAYLGVCCGWNCQ